MLIFLRLFWYCLFCVLNMLLLREWNGLPAITWLQFYKPHIFLQLQTVPKDSLMRNCTWNDNSTWHNITPSDTEIAMYNIDGAQDSAEWFGLRELPTDTGKFTDSLPYYIGVNVNIISWKSANFKRMWYYFGIEMCMHFCCCFWTILYTFWNS